MSEPHPTRRGPGRARDVTIDERVLAAAARQLADLGYEAMSVAAVADEAGTTRQALYRRWPGKSELATAAVAAIPPLPTVAPGTAVGRRTDSGTGTDDPFADLVAELVSFRRDISRPGRLSLVGTMLQDSVHAEVRSRYRARVIAPRRRRILRILERARDLDLIDDDADLPIIVTMATGSWYARALASDRPPADWPRRTAAVLWRAAGGTAP